MVFPSSGHCLVRKVFRILRPCTNESLPFKGLEVTLIGTDTDVELRSGLLGTEVLPTTVEPPKLRIDGLG